MQFSTTLRSNQSAQIPLTLMDQGGQPIMNLFNGPLPPQTLLPDPPSLLATMLLPAVPMSTSNGTASMLGLWQTNALISGVAQCFRLYDALSVCHVQGFVSEGWQPSYPYVFGQQINNPNGLYRCVLAGVSASVNNGPIGIGNNIQDGSAQWQYLAASPDIVLLSTVVQASAQITVTSFTVTAGNA